MNNEERQLLFHPRNNHLSMIRDRSNFVGMTGAAGTGKTRTNLEKLHMCAEKYHKTRIAFVRQTRASLTSTVLVTFEEKVLPPDHFVKTDVTRDYRKEYKYQNGSIISLHGLDRPGKLLSSEYDIIYCPEIVENNYEDIYTLSTRLRNGMMPYQQLIFDTNPAPSEHWLKLLSDNGNITMYDTSHYDNPQYFQWEPRNANTIENRLSLLPKNSFVSMDVYKDDNLQRYRKYIEEAITSCSDDTILSLLTEDERNRVQSNTHYLKILKHCYLIPFDTPDNNGNLGRWSLNGMDYLNRLTEGEPQDVDRYFRGIWGSAEGIVYKTYSTLKTNIENLSDNDILSPFQRYRISPNDRLIAVTDFGFINPFVFCLFLLRNEKVYLLHQIYMTERTVKDHCQDIKTIMGWEDDDTSTYPYPEPEIWLCDHDAEDRATMEQELGIVTTPAYKSVRDGINAVQKWLKEDRIKILTNSLYTVDKKLGNGYNPINAQQEFPRYAWDQKKDTPVKKFDHAMDCFRYLFAYLEELRDKTTYKDVAQTHAPQSIVSKIRSSVANRHSEFRNKRRNREK